MNVIGYIRVSKEEQDLEKQKHLLYEYAQQHKLLINEFIEIEISSRRNTKERRIVLFGSLMTLKNRRHRGNHIQSLC